jgi:hypothetical protein
MSSFEKKHQTLLSLALRHARCYNGAAAFRGKLPPKTCLGNPNALRVSAKRTLRERSRLGRETPSGMRKAHAWRANARCLAVGRPSRSTGLTSCSAGLTRYLCRETLIKYWLPPGTPVAYGGKPACSAGFTARHNSWQRWIHRNALAPLRFKLQIKCGTA